MLGGGRCNRFRHAPNHRPPCAGTFFPRRRPSTRRNSAQLCKKDDSILGLLGSMWSGRWHSLPKVILPEDCRLAERGSPQPLQPTFTASPRGVSRTLKSPGSPTGSPTGTEASKIPRNIPPKKRFRIRRTDCTAAQMRRGVSMPNRVNPRRSTAAVARQRLIRLSRTPGSDFRNGTFW